MNDPIVESVRQKLHYRSQVGIQKYGTDMGRSDLTYIQWLNHLQEELMDASVYIERIIKEAEKMQEDFLNGNTKGN